MANQIKAQIAALVFLSGCGLEPEPSPSLFGDHDGGTDSAVGGAGGAAGSAPTSDAAPDAAPDVEIDAAVCTPGEERDCQCYEGAGHQACDAVGGGFGVCKNNSNACCGAPSGWPGCGNTGCGVCLDAVTGYPKYFLNHPECFVANGCVKGAFGIPDAYGACSAACPAPGEVDK